MALLNEGVQGQVRQVFARLSGPVKLVVITQGKLTSDCPTCEETRQLIEEIGALDDRIKVEVYDYVKDKAIARQYKVDKIPAVAILGGPGYKDWGIRFYGIPSGYEFSSLIEDILMASKGHPNLSPKTLRTLEKLNRPTHLQVYVTPT